MPHVIRNLISIPGFWFAWQRGPFVWNELSPLCRCLQRLIIQTGSWKPSLPGPPLHTGSHSRACTDGLWKYAKCRCGRELKGESVCLDLREAQTAFTHLHSVYPGLPSVSAKWLTPKKHLVAAKPCLLLLREDECQSVLGVT